MPARRDYGDAWRDATATLAHVPVAGLLSANYFVQQWVERTSAFLMLVKMRFELARAASIRGENLMAGALSDDVIDAARTLTRSLVSLPAETAKHFDSKVEDGVREILDRVQPDAETDPHVYVKQELQKIARDVERLRQVARASAMRPGRPRRRRPPSKHDRDVAAIERVLRSLQTATDRATEVAPPAKPQPAKVRNKRYAALTRSIQHLEARIGRLKLQRDNESALVLRPRARRGPRKT